MQIISHRGLWTQLNERNQESAFIRSFDLGLGTETDLRDCQGKIVIAHDMPKGDELTFEALLQLVDGRDLPLALNIKADGIGEEVKELLKKYHHTSYFTFDMSIPDMVVQVALGLQVYTGVSDIMPHGVLLDKAQGVWLDCFNSVWYSANDIDRLLPQAKNICIVSADLHKRDVTQQWEAIKSSQSISSNHLMLCTDKALEAMNYFEER